MNLKQFLNHCVNKKEYIYHTTVFEQNQDGTNTENKNIGWKLNLHEYM